MLIRLALSWLDRRIDARIERDRQRQAADHALADRIDRANTSSLIAYADLEETISERLSAAENIHARFSA